MFFFFLFSFLFFFFFFVLNFFFFFFFQAEDGIRDAQESRGLGDVYKRQRRSNPAGHRACAPGRPGTDRTVARWIAPAGAVLDSGPVSYTHLTLPTILR